MGERNFEEVSDEYLKFEKSYCMCEIVNYENMIAWMTKRKEESSENEETISVVEKREEIE